MWHTYTGMLISSISRGCHAYGKDCNITAVLKILNPYRGGKKHPRFHLQSSSGWQSNFKMWGKNCEKLNFSHNALFYN